MHTSSEPSSAHLSSALWSERMLTGYWKAIWAGTGGCLFALALAQLVLRLNVDYTL
ncbi:MAG: hypothetical protein ACE37F_32975 [Nannocystaceae bacterium]